MTTSDHVIPSQLRTLSRWPDGTIKWVLVDTQVDVAAHGTTTLQLVAGNHVAEPVEAIELTETDHDVTVCTGPLRFTVRRDRVAICEDVELGARSDEGNFTPHIEVNDGAGMEIWGRISEGASLGGTKRRIYGIGSTCRASLAPDAWSVTVEESGPLRAVITCRGALEAEAPMHHYRGYRPIHFTLRLYAYAGQPFLRILHTTVMTLNPQQVEVEELGLRWSLPATDGLRCRAGGLEDDVTLVGEDRLELRHVNGEQGTIARFGHAGSGDTIPGGGTAPDTTSRDVMDAPVAGWLTAFGSQAGLGVAMRHMAEECPKALRIITTGEATTGAVDALPYSHPDSTPLDLARYAEDVAWHEGEGIYSDGTGTAKTTELFVSWFEPAQEPVAAQTLEGLLAQPHVGIAPDHLATCQVTGGFEPASDQFPASERLLGGLIDWLRRQIVDGRWVGFLDWGDFLIAFEESAQTWRYHGRWGWCNSEWDPRHGVWIQYLRSGDPALFDLAEAMTRHSADVDTCHWHGYRPYFVGGCFRHSVSHFSDEPSASHTFLDNWIDYYYLTGDLRTLEVLREAGEFCKRYNWTEDARFSFSLRSIANVLRGLLYVYEVTQDESCLQRALEVYEVVARGQNPDGSWNKRFQVSTPDKLPTQLPFGMATEGTTLAVELGAPAFSDEEHLALAGGQGPIRHEVPLDQMKGYQTHYLLIGIELLHRLTGRQDVEQVYRRGVDWFCGGDPEAEPTIALREHYGGILCRHLAYAWRLSGNEAYLAVGRAVLRHLMSMQDRSDDPMRHGAIGMSPMYVSLTFFGVPYLLQALSEAGLAEPEDAIEP